jgi:hypothetical protein
MGFSAATPDPRTPPHDKYKNWIARFVLDTADGLCVEYSYALRSFFPELQLFCGRVLFPDGSDAYHAWCLTPERRIVDPTRKQFSEEELTYDLSWQWPEAGSIRYCEDFLRDLCREIGEWPNPR